MEAGRGARVGVLGQVAAGVPRVALPPPLLLVCGGLVQGLGLDQGAGVGLHLAVKGDQGQGEEDAGDVKQETPADRRPEAIKGLDNLEK